MKVSCMRRKGLGQHVARQISRWETLGLKPDRSSNGRSSGEGKRGPAWGEPVDSAQGPRPRRGVGAGPG